jgi:hypothetical protein
MADSDTEFMQQLLDEKEGLIPKGFAERIEHDFTAGDIGIMRRVALALLETPWSETAEKVMADRQLAIALAHLSEVLESHLERYELLAGWLRAARARMELVLALRVDKDSVYADAKRTGGEGFWRLRLIIDNVRRP